MVSSVKNVCIQCNSTDSLRWWKCCPEHTTEQGTDVICETCTGKLHPELVNFVTGLTEAVISPYMDVFGMGVKSFNSRGAREIAPFKYKQIINAIDWNRTLIQAYAEHERVHGNAYSTTCLKTCGVCIKTVLLRTDE